MPLRYTSFADLSTEKLKRSEEITLNNSWIKEMRTKKAGEREEGRGEETDGEGGGRMER